MPAPTARPIPRPRFVTFFFSSSWASSSSSRKSELACSATWRAVAPRPEFFSVAWVCIVSPVDEPCEDDAGCEGDADDQERVRPAAPAGLLRFASGGIDGSVGRRLVLRRPALRARLDQARLELAQERGVVGQSLRELGGHASFGGGLVCHALEVVRRAVDGLVALRGHRLTGGSSPVATRQIAVAVLRAASVAAAASDA